MSLPEGFFLMRILLIEDDLETAQTIRDGVKHRYAIDLTETAREALSYLESSSYDVIILDLNLPDSDGIKLCQRIRANKITAPILILTASIAVEDKVRSLDAGADDFLSKPFSFAELHARLRALSRRGPQILYNRISIKHLILDPESGEVFLHGKKIELRRREFQILEYLMRNAGRVVTRDMLFEHVWESNANPSINTIDVHIKFLRDKIDKPHGSHRIQTIRGLGYKID